MQDKACNQFKKWNYFHCCSCFQRELFHDLNILADTVSMGFTCMGFLIKASGNVNAPIQRLLQWTMLIQVTWVMNSLSWVSSKPFIPLLQIESKHSYRFFYQDLISFRLRTYHSNEYFQANMKIRNMRFWTFSSHPENIRLWETDIHITTEVRENYHFDIQKFQLQHRGVGVNKMSSSWIWRSIMRQYHIHISPIALGN